MDLVNALVRDGIRELDEPMLLKYLCYFAKTAESQELLKLQLDYLLMMASCYHPVFDETMPTRDGMTLTDGRMAQTITESFRDDAESFREAAK
jgi:hypothetical protein